MLTMIQERSDLGYSKVCNIALHKISIIDFFNKCDQIRRTSDLVTFNEEILNGKPHFWCSVMFDDEICKSVNLEHKAV